MSNPAQEQEPSNGDHATALWDWFIENGIEPEDAQQIMAANLLGIFELCEKFNVCTRDQAMAEFVEFLQATVAESKAQKIEYPY